MIFPRSTATYLFTSMNRFFIEITKAMNHFRFPVDETYIDDNESIHSVVDDEDDLMDSGDRYLNQSDDEHDEETQMTNALNRSQLDQIQPTILTVTRQWL